ncbi:MAG: haloacid dehalogenase-like hydrolase [Planctomycetales bacterium]|nr:haloacid dehalogenase-like hydrolase [Planctomycetales bacterium]
MRTLITALFWGCLVSLSWAAEPLASWHEGTTKAAIVKFVERVCEANSAEFVPPSERIAVFDNDGTLWCEQPMYVQLAFALDRVKAMAADHPEWKSEEPFKSVLNDDFAGIAAAGKAGLLKIIAVTHAGMTNDQFESLATQWLATAKHPRFKRSYTECVYQPMLELLDYLRANHFKTYIVSGGGIEMIRVFSSETYGIPPEQVVGSSIKLVYERRDGQPALVRQPEVDFIDDKEGKPVGIQKFIGRRPVIAVGNSDGDFEMLEYTTSGQGPRLGIILHHTDAEREYAYDRSSHFGRLDKALTEAKQRNWLIVDMQVDWDSVFPR